MTPDWHRVAVVSTLWSKFRMKRMKSTAMFDCRTAEQCDLFRNAFRLDHPTWLFSSLDTITRFYNYLFYGRKSGTRRASQELLNKWFPKKTNERKAVISTLVKVGLLHEGSYRNGLHGTRSKKWMLDKSIVTLIAQAKKQHRIAS